VHVTYVQKREKRIEYHKFANRGKNDTRYATFNECTLLKGLSVI